MTSSIRLCSCLVLATVASTMASTAAAQGHLLVPSQFAQIGAAVLAATPGTIIEVQWQAQPYQPFVIDRPVTIVGSASDQMAPMVEVAQGIGIDFQLAAGERATVSRIDVRAATNATLTQAVWVQGGHVTLEDCRFRGGPDPLGTVGLATLEVVDAEVNLAFCRIEGLAGVGSLRAVRSRIAATKTRFFGGTMPAGNAVRLDDSDLHATECWLLGGEDFLGGPGATAMEIIGNSRAWLVDCSGRGGMGQPGGVGLINTTPVAVQLLRSMFVGGMDFGTFVTAPATIGILAAHPGLVGQFWNEPPYRRGTLQPGQPWAVHAALQPGALAVIALSLAPTGTSVTWTEQPAMLPQDIALAIPVIASSFGYASYGSTLPNAVNLRGIGLWAQTVTGTALPLQASPLSGVVVR